MEKHLIIPGIGERIKRQLNELNLAPEIDPIDFVKKKKELKHRYYSNCRDSENRKVSFYARIHDNEDAKNKMIREIIFLKEIKKNEKLGINKYIPGFIGGEIKNNFEWLVREYVKGKPLGKLYSLKRKLSVEDISFFVDTLMEIHEIPVDSLGNKITPYLNKSGNYEQYLSLLRIYRRLLRGKVISNRQYQKVSRFFYQNKELINSQKKVIAHSDIHQGNIIVNSKRWLIDWELVRLDNFTYDIAFLWLHLWETDLKFRRKLIEEFLKRTSNSAVFKKLFRLTILYILAREMDFLFLVKKTKTGITGKRYRFFKKLFKNTLKDFESTLKI